jgi:putative ABC transport system permease protein
MLRVYILLALKVLQRRKFYTFISLFCISVTLMVILLVTSLVENIIHPPGAERNSDRFLAIEKMAVSASIGGRNRREQPGYQFLNAVIKPMETPQLTSIFSTKSEVAGFRNGKRIKSQLKRTDSQYWQILQFYFIEGRPFSETEAKQGQHVAVISEDTARQYFDDNSAVGKSLTVSGESYQVIGVVENVSVLHWNASADIWVPLFASASTAFTKQAMGGFMGLIMAEKAEQVPTMKREFNKRLAAYKHPDPKRWPIVVSSANTKFEQVARLYHRDLDSRPKTKELTIGIIVTMILFMLLPTINLINLNISRILERASEIGVRKNFGARSSHLITQFLLENIILTCIGGVIGFVLALLSMYFISVSGVVPFHSFEINFRVLAAAVSVILFFGILSGVYPAWKMSRMNPIKALKGAI